MRMVRVRHMRMSVPHRFMSMRMAMRSGRHRFVRMAVVAVVVRMGVFVLQFVVDVLMAMRFGQVQ